MYAVWPALGTERVRHQDAPFGPALLRVTVSRI